MNDDVIDSSCIFLQSSIQESIRAMPTPDSMDVVNFSTAIQSLNLAICEQKTELPLLKKNVTNNSKSKMAKEEGEKLPNIIKRAKTEPTFNYSLLQTKVSQNRAYLQLLSEQAITLPNFN